jgi:hypothetical protein
MTRKGITLTEALVALFIAALGMISLLTLFPLGALQMGQALKDSRSAQAGQEADGLMRWYWAKYETDPLAASPILQAMDTGDGAAAIATGPSYPVLIDPQGFVTTWTGGYASQSSRVAGFTTFPRRTVYESVPGGATATYLPLLRRLATDPAPMPATPLNQRSEAKIERFTVLQDELEYGESQRGVPGSAALNGKVERGAQYSWSWLLQRPNNARRGLVNMQVVVYYKRSPFFANADTERRYSNVSFEPGSTKVSINYAGFPRPELVKGRWILDATSTAGGSPLRHANYYRVVSVNADTANVLHLELETPIRRSDGGTATYTGDVVVHNRVAEVFDRPPLITGEATP